MAIPAKPKAPRYLMTRDGTCYAFDYRMAEHTDLYVGVDGPVKNGGPKMWDRLHEEQEQQRAKRRQALKDAADKRVQAMVLATKEDQDHAPYDTSDLDLPPEAEDEGVQIDDDPEPDDEDPDDTKVDPWRVPPQDEPASKSRKK